MVCYRPGNLPYDTADTLEQRVGARDEAARNPRGEVSVANGAPQGGEVLLVLGIYQTGRRDKTFKRVDFSADFTRNRRFGGRFSVRFDASYAGVGGIYAGR